MVAGQRGKFKVTRTKLTRQGGILAVFFLFFIILTSTTIAWDTFNYQNNRNAYYTETTATYNSSNIFTSISDGAGFQPLLIDLDNDNDIEIIGSDGNYIKIWKLSGGVIALDDEKDVGATQGAVASAIPTYDNSSLTAIISVIGTQNVTIWKYNSTEFLQVKSYLDDGTITSAPVCINTTHSSQVGCWWANDDGNITEIAWNGTDFSSGANINFSNSDIFTSVRGLYQTPPILDIDNDGVDEVLFICDTDDDTNEEICAWDVNSGSGSFSAESGELDIDTTTISSIVVSNLDDAGHDEVLVTYYKTGGGTGAQDSYLEAFKSDLTTSYFAKKTVYDEGGSSTTSKVSNPVVADFIDELLFDDDDICVVSQLVSSDAGDRSRIICYRASNGAETFSYTTDAGEGNQILYWNLGGTIAGAELYTDDYDKVEMVVGGSFLSLDSDEVAFQLNFTTLGSTESSSSIALVDFQNDLYADICGMRANNVYCTYMSITNNLPVLSEFDINTGNPVCVGESVIISASEGSEYTNDLSVDTERIAVKFPNATTQYGSYSLSNPSFTFTTPSAGTYALTIYLQQLADSTDTSVYSTYNLIVSNNNDTCKESGENPTTSTTTGAVITSDEDVSGFMCGVLEGFGLSCGSAGTTIIWVIGIQFGVAMGLIGAGIYASFPHLLTQVFLIIVGTLLGAVNGWVTFIIGFCLAGYFVIELFTKGNGGV